MFIYDRRESYFDHQDVAPDHRFALMRWSGEPTTWDDLHDQLTRVRLRFKTRLWGGWGHSRPDRKRQKKGHRS